MIKKYIYVIFAFLILFTYHISANGTAAIKGTVYEGTVISLTGKDYNSEFISGKKVIDDYSFLIDSLPAGKYTINLNHIDFKPVIFNITLSEGEVLDLGNIEPDPKPGVIEGVISSNNKSLKNVIIKLGDNSFKTDENGYFRIDNLEHTYDKEPFILRISYKGYETTYTHKEVGINRLTFANIDLNIIDYTVKGQVIPESIVKVDNDKVIAEEGMFSLKWNVEKDSKLNIFHDGYEDVTVNIDPEENRQIDLGTIQQKLNTYKITSFNEDCWFGAYFYKENLTDRFYPFLNIKLNNNDYTKAEEILKRIISNYILVQDFKVINILEKNNISNTKDLDTYLKNNLGKDKETFIKELILLSELKDETSDLYIKLNSIVDKYTYRFYHINLVEEKKAIPSDEKAEPVYRDYVNLYLTKFKDIENELSDSMENTDIINNMIPLDYDTMISYEDSPLITSYEIYNEYNEDDYISIKKVEPQVMLIRKEDIKQIVFFFNIFTNSLVQAAAKENDINLSKIDIQNWYKWKEIFNDKYVKVVSK